MIVRVIIMWAALVSIIGGTAYMIFPWYNFNAIILLAIASGIVTAIVVGFAKMRGAGGGGGGAQARASTRSKGARGREK